MRHLFIAAAAAATATALAGIPAAAQTDPDVIWRGGFEAGAGSLTGNCAAGQDEWCNTQTIRPQQMQVVPDPVAQGHAALRVEVRYGDVYNGYSDSRSLITGPLSLWEDEGNERWYRWQTLWPQDWVGSYPKWDQLTDPLARSHGGSIVEWHQDEPPGVYGSAPIYIWGDDKNIVLCLVDQTTSACREQINLAPLQRSHWHDFVVHAKWSSNPSIGYLEIWIDGVNVLPKHIAATMYPGMRNYLVAGLYRNGHIGDPNLLWPDGTHVYGTDGAPGVVYLDGFIIGKTQASVLAERPWGPAAADAGLPTPADGGAGTSNAAVDAGAASSGRTGLAAIGYPSGCTSIGSHLLWIGLPLLLVAALRRRAALRNATASRDPEQH